MPYVDNLYIYLSVNCFFFKQNTCFL